MIDNQDTAPRRPGRHSLRNDLGLQLLALYLLFVGPVTIAAVVFDVLISARLQADVKAADLALARAIAHETDAILVNAIKVVEQLGQEPAVREVDLPEMETLFGNVNAARPDVNLIYRLGPDGMMLFHYPVGPGSTIGVDFSFRDYFKNALDSTEAVVSKGRISPTTEQAVATTVMPIRDPSGIFMGVVATNIRLESLSEAFAAIAQGYQPSERFKVSIVDSAGQIIADPDPLNLLTTLGSVLPSVVHDVLQGNAGSSVDVDQGGEEWLSSYVPIPAGDWGVVVRRPTAVAFASARSFHQVLMTAIGVFLIIGLLFWLALTRRVIRPLEYLAAFSQAIGRSHDEMEAASDHDRMLRLSGRSDQMGYLVRSLRRMEQSIKRRLTELSTLLDTSKAVVSTLDSRVVLDRILEQTSRLVGADTCGIVGLDLSQNEFRIRASRGLSESYTRRLRIDPSEPNSASMRAIRTGQPIQVSDTETDPTYVTFRPRSRAEGFQALLAVPLPTKYTPPAALLVYSKEPRVFTDREVGLVWNFANHAAMAIENAALYARSDERLQEQTRRLEALVQSLTDGLILEDHEGRVLYCNRRVLSLVELTPEEAHQTTASAIRRRLLTSAKDPETIYADVEHAMSDGGSKIIEFALDKDGRSITLRLQSFDVTDSQGEVIGRGQFIQDISHDRELDRMKTSLIATVSHELRTPLAAIKGYASTLLADDVQWSSEAQQQFLGVISRETDRLSALVSDLLDLSRLEGGSFYIDRSDCDFKDLVARAIDRLPILPVQKLIFEIDPELPTLTIDRRRIEAVLFNLLDNAMKYAGSDSPVRISASQHDGHVLMRVEDEGPGIPVEYIDRVFEPFFRLDDGLSRTASGAGLGLSICRGFVRAHGGEMWIEPREKGTCVAFSLPIERPEADG